MVLVSPPRFAPEAVEVKVAPEDALVESETSPSLPYSVAVRFTTLEPDVVEAETSMPSVVLIAVTRLAAREERAVPFAPAVTFTVTPPLTPVTLIPLEAVQPVWLHASVTLPVA